ncbi:MAG TPA: DUF4212 domain-containing protein [Longimicrobiales bacterium]|nr:DUF4212 domain-containing protein [Longimicrobiales bacterium]
MPADHDEPVIRPATDAYWRRNLRYLAVLLAIWFAVSYGAGILLAEPLNRFRIPGTGFPLGFWFAQQGSIYVFVVLIFVYVILMNRLDLEFDVDEESPGVRGPRRTRPGADRGRAP